MTVSKNRNILKVTRLAFSTEKLLWCDWKILYMLDGDQSAERNCWNNKHCNWGPWIQNIWAEESWRAGAGGWLMTSAPSAACQLPSAAGDTVLAAGTSQPVISTVAYSASTGPGLSGVCGAWQGAMWYAINYWCTLHGLGVTRHHLV